MNTKGMIPGDWVIREGPAIKAGDFGAYSGDLMLNPLTMQVGQMDLQNALAFTTHAVYVEDVTDSHLTVFDPFQGQSVIVQLANFAGTWRLATKKQVETTWTLAKKLVPQPMIPLLEATMRNYPYREMKNR